MQKTDIITEAMSLIWPGEKPPVDCTLRLHHAFANAMEDVFSSVCRANGYTFHGNTSNLEALLPRSTKSKMVYATISWYCADYWHELPNHIVTRYQAIWREVRPSVLHACQSIDFNKLMCVGGYVDVRV